MPEIEKSNQQEKKLEHLSTLYEIGLTLDYNVDLHKRLYLVLKAIARALRSQVALYLPDEINNQMILKSTDKEMEPHIRRIPLDTGIVGRVAKDSKSILKPDSVLCVPLSFHEKVIGVLECTEKEEGALFDTEDQRLLSAISNQVSMSIENTHLFETVITEKKRLEVIIQSIGEGLFITDTEKRILLWNPSAENINGFSQDETIGKHCYEVLKIVNEEGKNLCDTECPLSNCFSFGKPAFWSERPTRYLQKKNGEKIPISGVASPIIDLHGNLFGGIVVFRDISREKEIDRMKSELVSMVSHELRTPLTNIMAIISILRELNTKLEEKKKTEFLEIMHRQGERLIRLINNFLDVSKIEAGKMEMIREEISIPKLVDQVIKNLKAVTEKHQFITKIPSDFPHIIADLDKIEQLIINLLSNAIKYSPEGGEIVIVAEEQQEFIQISIQDRGVGISSQDLPKVFGRFQRLNPEISREQPGTGLGLSICKGIVEMHKGKIWVESPPAPGEKGSKFVFTLSKQ